MDYKSNKTKPLSGYVLMYSTLCILVLALHMCIFYIPKSVYYIIGYWNNFCETAELKGTMLQKENECRTLRSSWTECDSMRNI